MKKKKDPGFGYSSKKNKKVFQIHSYTSKDIKFDVKFEASTSFNDSGFTLLDHNKLSDLTALKD